MKSVYSKPINPPKGSLQTVTAKPGPLSQNVGGVSYMYLRVTRMCFGLTCIKNFTLRHWLTVICVGVLADEGILTTQPYTESPAQVPVFYTESIGI